MCLDRTVSGLYGATCLPIYIIALNNPDEGISCKHMCRSSEPPQYISRQGTLDNPWAFCSIWCEGSLPSLSFFFSIWSILYVSNPKYKGEWVIAGRWENERGMNSLLFSGVHFQDRILLGCYGPPTGFDSTNEASLLSLILWAGGGGNEASSDASHSFSLLLYVVHRLPMLLLPLTPMFVWCMYVCKVGR